MIGERVFGAAARRHAATSVAHVQNHTGFRGRAAVIVVAAALAITFAGATLPTPLYALYQRTFGFSSVVLTMVYAAYVVGNLCALLFLGRLSDQAGRRPVALGAVCLGVASVIVFLLAKDTVWLFAARIVSGMATGLAGGTATAWLSEMPAAGKSDTGWIATTANFIGVAVGPLAAGLLAQFAVWPIRLSYLVYLPALAAAATSIRFVGETVAHPKRHVQDLSLAPRLGVPQGARVAFVPPAVTGFVIFALMGFYAALIPHLLSESLKVDAPAVSGAIVFELYATAAFFSVAMKGLPGRPAMLSGLALLPIGLWLLIVAQFAKSMPILIVATAIGGAAGGLGYRGSLEVVTALAPAKQRSEVLSSFLVAVYLGNSVPVIGIGLLTAAAGSSVSHVTFAAIITLMAVAAAAIAIISGAHKRA
jgi:MFS family permease